MKLIDMTCPHCGGALKIDPLKKIFVCNYCGSKLILDDENLHIHFDNAEESGYQFEKGRQRAQAELSDTQTVKTSPKTQNNNWIWIIGWLLIFPLPLTILLYRNKSLDKKIKYIIIAIAWIVYLIIGFTVSYNKKNKSTDTNSILDNSTSIASSTYQETTSKHNSFEITTTTTTITQNNIINDDYSDSQNNTNDYKHKDLKGHGMADIGRDEPDYIGVKGYVVVYGSQEYDIEKSDDFQNHDLWNISTYERDKQLWNITDITIAHKTEVVVREQILEHEGWGAYSGYLLVEKTDDKSQYYIDVENFITKPYWTYSDNIIEAAKTGIFVAKFKQKSDYYPVTRDNEKVEIDNDTYVLVKGLTDAYGKRGPDNNINQIEAVLWKEWKLGYGGVDCYFNENDLEIVY